MKNLLRGLIFFALSLVLGEVVRRLLVSRPGEALVTRLGRAELATAEGASAASKEARRALGFVRSLTEAREKPPALLTSRPTGWIGVARDASEMLLAAGALLKTAADFVQEDQKLQRRIRHASKAEAGARGSRTHPGSGS